MTTEDRRWRTRRQPSRSPTPTLFFWFVDDASDDRQPSDLRSGHSLAAMAAEDRRDAAAAQQVSIDVFFYASIVCCLGGSLQRCFFLGSLVIFSIVRGLDFDPVRSEVASL